MVTTKVEMMVDLMAFLLVVNLVHNLVVMKAGNLVLR
jgi:hypothetical protein